MKHKVEFEKQILRIICRDSRHSTQHLVISRCCFEEDIWEIMYQQLQCTCTTIALLIKVPISSKFLFSYLILYISQ